MNGDWMSAIQSQWWLKCHWMTLFSLHGVVAFRFVVVLMCSKLCWDQEVVEFYNARSIIFFVVHTNRTWESSQIQFLLQSVQSYWCIYVLNRAVTFLKKKVFQWTFIIFPSNLKTNDTHTKGRPHELSLSSIY